MTKNLITQTLVATDITKESTTYVVRYYSPDSKRYSVGTFISPTKLAKKAQEKLFTDNIPDIKKAGVRDSWFTVDMLPKKEVEQPLEETE